jgi:tetratricopeptide (TPR) repeat protein
MARRKKKSGKSGAVKSSFSLKRFPFPKSDSSTAVWETGFWSKHSIPAILLFLLPFALYFPATGYQYVLDDQIVITDNAYTKSGIKGLWNILTTESMQGYFKEQKNIVAGNRYRPLSIMTFAIEHEYTATEYTDNEGNTMTVASPWVTHFNNILLYSLTVLLLFRIFGILFPTGDGKWWFGLPFAGALLYALHPTHVEAVANVKGRDEIMVVFLSLAALYASIRHAVSGGWLWMVVTGFTFFLALLAKENAVTFIAAIPLTLLFFVPGSRLRTGFLTGMLVVVFLLYLRLRMGVIGSFFNEGSGSLLNDPFVEMNGGQRLATIMYTMLEYLRLLIFPHPLTHDYYPYHIPIMEWTDWKVWLSAFIHIGLITAAIIQFSKRTILSWSILFYFITMSIVSNLVFPIGTFMNERFLFMPSVAYTALAAWALVKWAPDRFGRAGRYAGLAVLALTVAGYAIRTVTRVPVWESPLTLNRAAVKVSKNSIRANCFVGTALYHEYRGLVEAGKVEEARPLLDEAHRHIHHALSIYPAYTDALTMKGGIAAERYKFDRDLNKLLQEFYDIIVARGRVDFIDQYIEYLFGGRAPQATMVNFIHRVAHDHFLMGARTTQDYSYAVHYLNMALKGAPDNARLLYDLSLVYQAAGNPSAAQQYLDRARAADPGIGSRQQ